MYFNNYYLDAHSSISSTELLDITIEIVSLLPALKSIIFEMLPEYLNNGITRNDVERQFIKMQRLWEKRGNAQRKKSKADLSHSSGLI